MSEAAAARAPEVVERRWIRRFLTALLRIAARLFFRRIEVTGLDRIPDSGPVVFVGNHPNALIDPLLLATLAPRPLSFLAKAPLFRYPVIGFFVRAFDSIPVHRKQEGGSPEQTRETFAVARRVLTSGGGIAIFPEGASHSGPKLRELKTGVARIALGAGAPGGEAVRIVPTGIYYTAKHAFRSAVLVCFGEPIVVEPVGLGEAGEPPAEDVDAVMRDVESAIRGLTLEADSVDALDFVRRAEELFSARDPRIKRSLSDELQLRREFIAGYAWLRETDPVRLEQLASRFRRFDAEMRAARLAPDELVSRSAMSARVGLRLGATLIVAVLLLPLAVAGLVVHYPVYWLIGALASHYARGEDDVLATNKFVGGFFLFPLWWLALAVAADFRWGREAAVAVFALLPILGFITLRVFEKLDVVIGKTRAVMHRMAGRRWYLQLIAERRALRAELAAERERFLASARLRRGL